MGVEPDERVLLLGVFLIHMPCMEGGLSYIRESG